MAKVLILCPTFDHADTLFASIASVRVQTFPNWEMAVICDGSPPRTDAVLAPILASDARIRAYRHPKSPRNGEEHRDALIRASDAEFICHLSDDDVWACDHLAKMVALLEYAEWVNQAPIRLEVAGGIEWWPVNHGTQAMRDAITRHVQLSAGINYVAYRRDVYLRLPVGWSCAPPEVTTDVFMWAKFFRDSSVSVASIAETSAIKLPSKLGVRGRWTPEDRIAEMTPWLARAAEPGVVDRLSRSGSVLIRMISVFALHGAGSSLNLSFERAGLLPSPAEAEPQPAVNGAPMILPLTKEQRAEAARAHLFVRAYACHDEAAREAWQSSYEGAPPMWLRGANVLANTAGPDAALRAVNDCREVRPNLPAPVVAAAQLAIRANRRNDAARFVDELSKKWPDHPALAQLKRSVERVAAT